MRLNQNEERAQSPWEEGITYLQEVTVPQDSWEEDWRKHGLLRKALDQPEASRGEEGSSP